MNHLCWAQRLESSVFSLLSRQLIGKTLSGMTLSKLVKEPRIAAVPHGFRSSFLVHDGAGQPPVRQDIGVAGEPIGFVGDASAASLDAAVAVDVNGLLVTPGFIDMHSHAELTEDYGREALPFLHQGITTVAIGVDGGGTPDVAELFAGLEGRIEVNTFAYAGHGEIRERVIGADDRAPTRLRGQLPGRRLSRVDTRGDPDR